MKQENTYWVVAKEPGVDYRHVLLSHYKPHYLKSSNEWVADRGDWQMVPVSIFNRQFVEGEFYEPQKVKITVEFNN